MNKGMKFGVAAAIGIVCSACNGWPDATDFDEASNQPEKYLTYEATPADSVPMFVAEHHRYMVMPTRTDLHIWRSTQVGSAGGGSVFALEGDDAPYGNLFVQTANGELRRASVID